MDIINRDSYYNSIYKGYIVNDSLTDDPEGLNRYQIYIPEVHYGLIESNVEEYRKLDSSSKKSSPLFYSLPWAVSLVSGLVVGDPIYGSYIENSNNSFIILGKNAEAAGIGGFDGEYGISTDAILDLAMPIIVENEVGINRNNWPNGITEGQFGNVTSNDKGAWSIGIIQWHGCRAFDVLYQIAAADSNWLSNWTDQSLNIVSDLQASLKNGSSSPKRNNWDITVYNHAITLGAHKMLVSAKGKETQISFARQETKVSLDQLMDEPYGITNPGILIFCMDIMNQYGNGVNGVITGCLTEAAKISKNGKDIMTQLKEYYDYWKRRTSAYSSRRKNTYDYLVEIEKQGKLSALTFIDLTILEGLKHIPEYGEYFWPVPSTDYISCFWGENRKALPYSFKYNSPNNYQGYSGGGAHTGLDIAGKEGCAVIAVGNGTVAHVNGGGVVRGLTGAGPGQGNCIAIKMDKNPNHYFVYMHLCKEPTYKVGDRVKAGDTLGYMGSTGNSTGTHLHIGLHLGAVWPSPSNLSTRIDPLPYFGKKVQGIVTNTVRKTSGQTTGDDIVNYAKTFLGCKYVWGATGPDTFDCSGLTYYVYKHFGYKLHRVSSDQRTDGTGVDKNHLQKGDLVHFTGHVGIYVGDGNFIHAPHTGDVVKISSLSEDYYVKNYWGARRIL